MAATAFLAPEIINERINGRPGVMMADLMRANGCDNTFQGALEKI